MKKIIYYLLLFIGFIILTIMMPYYAIKEYNNISSVGAFKLKWLIQELADYYGNFRYALSMIILN